MLMRKWRERLEWAVLVGLILGAGTFAHAQAERPDRDTTLLNDLPAGRTRDWIGVVCRPMDPALRAQLDRSQDDGGLVISHVAPDSPADKAGLKKHDLLLAVDDTPLTNVRVLIDKVRAADGEALDFTVLRGGEKQSLSVTPEERPSRLGRDARRGGRRGGPRDARPRREAGRDEDASQRPWRLRRIVPGVLFGPLRDLPDDVSVTITKRGREPADIVVTQGDQRWEATEDELSKLPDRVRRMADRVLGRDVAFDVDLDIVRDRMPPPATRYIDKAYRLLQGEDAPIRRRIKELNERVDELTDRLGELTGDVEEDENDHEEDTDDEDHEDHEDDEDDEDEDEEVEEFRRER